MNDYVVTATIEVVDTHNFEIPVRADNQQQAEEIVKAMNVETISNYFTRSSDAEYDLDQLDIETIEKKHE